MGFNSGFKGLISRPGRFNPAKKLRYPMNSRLGGPHSRPGRFGEYKSVSLLPKLEYLLPSYRYRVVIPSRCPYRIGIPWAVTVKEDVARGWGDVTVNSYAAPCYPKDSNLWVILKFLQTVPRVCRLSQWILPWAVHWIYASLPSYFLSHIEKFLLARQPVNPKDSPFPERYPVTYANGNALNSKTGKN